MAIAEVSRALQRLKNQKACGEDLVHGELLKYGAEYTGPIVADLLNTSITRGLDFSSVVGPGVLIPLAKPNKPRGPLTSLRPIVLLNTIRKVFSLVILARISTAVSEFLGPTSSGFRAARRTSDVVFTQRWLSAKSQRYVWECHALGLDMSKAFDTINRAKLLDVMSSFLGRNEVHMIQHLLYGTTISVRMCSSTSKAFHTTIGTPQGDSLSPVLFVCYLEAALQECRPRLPQRPITDGGIPPETGYADDITFYSTSKPWLEESLPIISSTLHSWNLKVNEQKTEWVHFTSGDSSWRSIRQLGSLMGGAEDIDRRISLASQAYGSMFSLWLRRKHVSERSRLKLYSSLVLPVLLYNCETWGVTQAVFQRLDCFHRRQLRNLVGVRYPDRITNDDLYSRCDSQPLSELVAKRRRSLTGHVLRMSEQSPPCLAMSCYFQAGSRERRGRPAATLPTTIMKDLAGHDIPLKNASDLEGARAFAADKSK